MRFELSGSGFLELPDNAVAIIDNQGDPLSLRYSDDAWVVMRIVSRSEHYIVFEATSQYYFSSNHTIGAILSDDRETIYWVND